MGKIFFALLFTVLLFLNGCVPKDDAERHLGHAVDFIELRMPKEAVIELKNGLRMLKKKKNPAYVNENILILDALELVLAGDLSNAAGKLEEEIKLNKKNWSAYFLLGSIYAQEMKFDKTVSLYEKIPNSVINLGQKELALGIRSYSKGNYEIAILDFKNAQKKLSEGGSIFEEKEESSSMQFVKKGINNIILLMIARAYDEEGSLYQAKQCYEQLKGQALGLSVVDYYYENLMLRMEIKRNPKFADLYNSLGWNYFLLKNREKAIESFNAAIKLNQTLSLAYNNLGLVYLAENNTSLAKRCFLQAINLKNDLRASLYSYYNLGEIYAKENNVDLALLQYEEAIKISPDYEPARKKYRIMSLLKLSGRKAVNRSTLLDLADSYYEIGDYEKAGQFYKKIGESKRAYLSLGKIMIEDKRYKDAIAALQKTLKIDPQDSDAHYLLGLASKLKGDLTGAAINFKDAIRTNNQNKQAEARLQLAYVYFEEGKINEAVACFKALLKDKSPNIVHDQIKKIIEVLEG